MLDGVGGIWFVKNGVGLGRAVQRAWEVLEVTRDGHLIHLELWLGGTAGFARQSVMVKWRARGC